MSRYGFDDARGPWSLFLPVTMAIITGVLGAQGIGWVIGMVFADRHVARVTASSAPPAASAPVVRPNAMPVPADAPSATAPPGAGQASNTSRDAATSAAAGGLSLPASSPTGLSAVQAARATSPAAPAAASGESVRSPVDPDAERLQGPIAARREGDARACINSTVAVRSDNGWQQELSSDRPVRCTQSVP